MKDLYEVYIVETMSGKLYTGIAKDADKRFDEHLNDKRKGAKFFRSDPPKKILFRENGQNRSEASKLEARIKKLSRAKKIELISGSLKSSDI